MIIAGNDEAKRSKIWRVVTLVSSVLIILIAVYLLTRMFTTNPVVGTWESEDATIALKIEKNDTIQVDITDIAENTDAAVEMNYSVDMKSKIITITKDEEQIDKAVEKADGAYTKEDLENVLDDLDSSFSYSIDGNQMTLTEREYGEQFTSHERSSDWKCYDRRRESDQNTVNDKYEDGRCGGDCCPDSCSRESRL